MEQWNQIFKEQGKVFLKPQEDLPRIAKLFKENNVIRILDLGCGSGRHVVYLAKFGFDVYGIDIAENGIQITKDWLQSQGLKANFKIGSIYKKLPYGDNFFDAIISTQVIHHEKIQKIREAIKEIKRILKRGGWLFITVRKRKFRKSWPMNTVIEKYGKQKSNYRIIGPRTYMPTEGPEKGLIHYLFNKGSLKKEFNNFKICDIWVDSEKRHYCLLGGLKN